MTNGTILIQPSDGTAAFALATTFCITYGFFAAMSFYYTARLFWVGAYNIAWVGVMTTVASCLRGGSQVMTDCSGAGAVEAYFSVFAYFFEFLILIMLLRALDRTQRPACRLLAAWAGACTTATAPTAPATIAGGRW